MAIEVSRLSRHVLETSEFSFVNGNNQHMLLYKKTHISRTSKPGRESAIVGMTRRAGR